jgi:hypothetical protein
MSRVAVRAIEVEVDGRGGAVVLARRMDGLRVAKAAQVLLDRRVVEGPPPLAPGAQLRAQEELGVGADEPLGCQMASV